MAGPVHRTRRRDAHHRHLRTDIVEATHALYEQVLATWIDAPIAVTTTSGRPRAIHLGIRTLASPTPAVVRAWNHAVTTESTRRVTER